jgi:hypothetical protein
VRALAVLLLVACGSKPTPPAPARPAGSPFERFDTTSPRVGERAPDFALTDVEGKTVKLAEAIARGPVVLVWGSFT